MRFVYAAIAALFCALPLTAQTAIPTYKPHQTITISITFQGPDADKIKSASWVAKLSSDVSPSQPGFSSQMIGNASKPGSTANSFDVSFTVPTSQASGDYNLVNINAYPSNQDILLGYSPPEYARRVLRIDNPQTLVKPTIKDVKVLP
jgi:hypothetical protein